MMHMSAFFTLILAIFGSVKSMRILQISDIHLDVDYTVNGDPDRMCHQFIGPKFKLGQFGNYKCDSPKALLRHLMKHLEELIPDPDLILLTGDYIPHIKDYNQSCKYQFYSGCCFVHGMSNRYDNCSGVLDVEKSVQVVTDMLETKYPNNSVIPVFGNHDNYPSDYFPDQNCTNTFLKGGYYQYLLNENVTILVLNTNLYYRFNDAAKEFHDLDDPAGQFQFMIDTLERAKQLGKTVNVVAHIAPGTFERTPHFSWMFPKYNERFINITLEYANTIGWMIFGHHHTDTFHVVKDRMDRQVKQLYIISPSVTPWFSNLPGAGSVNPSFRIFDYDEKINRLNDIVTYFMNLTDLNNHPKDARWEKEYSMKEAYNLDAINAKTLNLVLEKLKQNDTSTWMKYIKYNSVGWNPKLPTGIYRNSQLCSIEFPNYDGYDDCMPKSYNGNLAVFV